MNSLFPWSCYSLLLPLSWVGAFACLYLTIRLLTKGSPLNPINTLFAINNGFGAICVPAKVLFSWIQCCLNIIFLVLFSVQSGSCRRYQKKCSIQFSWRRNTHHKLSKVCFFFFSIIQYAKIAYHKILGALDFQHTSDKTPGFWCNVHTVHLYSPCDWAGWKCNKTLAYSANIFCSNILRVSMYSSVVICRMFVISAWWGLGGGLIRVGDVDWGQVG